MNRILRTLAAAVPAPLLRWLGRVQFRIPLLRKLLTRLSGALGDGEAVIGKGRAKGLKINIAGAHPGYALGTSEPVLQDALAELLKPGDVFYDLGANVGFFTLLAARLVGSGGEVVAFEPDPRNVEVLRGNVERNALRHVAVVDKGVSGAEGTMTFALAESTASRLARAGEQGIKVSVTTLDAFVEQAAHRPPTLIKMDIEGAEVQALMGAARVLDEHRPTIICEVHKTEPEVRRLLEGAGYSMRLLEEDLDLDQAWNAHYLASPTSVPAR